MIDPIHFITGNLHKYSELAKILPRLVQVDIDLPEVQAVDSRDVIAAKLAEARKRMPGKAILAEDTALHLACLNGFLGAMIKWMLSSCGCEEIYRICAAKGKPSSEARTVLGYLAAADSEPLFFDAVMTGCSARPLGITALGGIPFSSRPAIMFHWQNCRRRHCARSRCAAARQRDCETRQFSTVQSRITKMCAIKRTESEQSQPYPWASHLT